jgi:hypothetical protein
MSIDPPELLPLMVILVVSPFAISDVASARRTTRAEKSFMFFAATRIGAALPSKLHLPVSNHSKGETNGL